MTLLVDVMAHPLDPGYAAAARERAGSSRRLGPATIALTVLVAVVCGWVTTAAVVDLRRPQPEAIRARAALESEIQRRTREVDRQQKRNEQLQAQIAAEQQAALAGDRSAALLARTRDLAVVTGEVPVTGPGLELTLNDAPGVGGQTPGINPRQDSQADKGRVLDRDLQVVVNGLWVAGAEAVAINGQRLTTLSAIRAAGQAILVDFRPLSPPYVIDAIGDPTSLQSGFGEDVAGEYLNSLTNNYGVQAGMAAKTSLTLPGAGSFSLRYATSRSSSAGSSSAGRSAPAPAPSSGTRSAASNQEVSP